MKYTEVTNLRFCKPDNTAVAMDVLFDQLSTPVEFVALPGDIEAHGRELYSRAIAGDFGAIAMYVAPIPTKELEAIQLKAQLVSALQKKAVELGFDNVADALTYCDEPAVPAFQTKALALRKWRSLVWAWFEQTVSGDFTPDVVNDMPKFE